MRVWLVPRKTREVTLKPLLFEHPPLTGVDLVLELSQILDVESLDGGLIKLLGRQVLVDLVLDRNDRLHVLLLESRKNYGLGGWLVPFLLREIILEPWSVELISMQRIELVSHQSQVQERLGFELGPGKRLLP